MAPVTENQEEIIQLQHAFYQDLYRMDPNIKFNIEGDADVAVPHDDIAADESPFLYRRDQDCSLQLK